LIATALLLIGALMFARFALSIPLANEIERTLFDIRAANAMVQVEEDERILLVVYTEDTLIDTEVRSPLDRGILARALANIDAMGPRAIGVDILFDQSTPSDGRLVEALSAMQTRTYLAFVSSSHNPEWIGPRQEDFLASFFARIGPGNVEPASVYLQTDADNVQRSWPPQPRDLPPLFANALVPGHDAFRDYSGSIAFETPLYEDGTVFTTLPIDWFADPEMAAGLADFVAGRYVLIGTDLQDRDRFLTPRSRITGGETTPGVAIHAQLLAQLLDGVMLRAVPGWALWLAAALAVVAGALTSLGDMRLLRLGLLILVQAAIILLVPYVLHKTGVDTQSLPVFGWVVGWAAAFASVNAAARSVGAEKRQFVTGALGKYLPADVAEQILSDPDRLSLHGEKCRIYALFTDLQGFTALSHAIEPEMVATLLNRYLDMLSETVLDHGGTLDKFVGDAVVAFWGAPISRPDDAERAAECALAMWRAGEEFRASAPDGVPPIGCTRVGLHYGPAVVGNFGGEGRIQYTALGDAMNTAARLESGNKHLDTEILASREAIEGVTRIAYRPLGRVTLSGRATPVEIYEPVLEITAGSAEALYTLFKRYDEGDISALEEIAEIARENPEDRALQNFVARLRKTEPGGTYVLQAK